MDTVWDVLNDWRTWDALPTGANRAGTLWQWGNDAYTVNLEETTGKQLHGCSISCPPVKRDNRARWPDEFSRTLRLDIRPVCNEGLHASVLLTVADAHVSTHVVVRVLLHRAGRTWPWQQARATRTVAQTVRACALRLRTLVQAAVPNAIPPGGCHTAIHHAHSTQPAAVVAATPDAPGYATALFPDSDEPGSTHPPDGVSGEMPSLIDALRERYPNTIACFEEMGAYEHLENVCRLEQRWERIMRGDYDTSVYEQVPTLLSDEQRMNDGNGNGRGRGSKRDGDGEGMGASDRSNGGPPLSDARHAQGLHPLPPNTSTDYDLIYAGSGLGLMHAAVMAYCYGWRVMVFDSGEVGWAHREWNISREELQALVNIGLVTWDELSPVIMREYRTGLVSFHRGTYSEQPYSELWMPDVLSLAIDASGLLRLMRRKLEAAGATILDRRMFRRVRVASGGAMQVEVELVPAGTGNDPHTHQTSDPHPHPPPVETATARLLLDGMGSTSPLTLLRYHGHPFGGFCPTVGTVVGGFAEGSGPRESDPTIGDILISISDTQTDSQLIWEGFPGRDDEVTVYVFYYMANDSRLTNPDHPYAPTVGRRESYSLMELFEYYLKLLPDYKRPGPNFRHIKPVYGYIPGRHSLRPNEVPLLRGVLPIGDSAAQQSPLTYCGFGSHVRNLHRTTSLLNYALRHNLLEPSALNHINAFQTNVSLNWVFSRFMQPWGHPHDVNELQNVFLKALNELGLPMAQRFFQDRMRWNDYNKIVGIILLRYPMIMVKAWHVLQASGVTRWIRDYTRFTLEALSAAGARAAGPRGEQLARTLSDSLSPAAGLWVRARYAEWRAMQWYR